ncbi:MAG: tyrosine-type recombinase/integrase [Pseudomonadales bacterium]|nr:tyrosine-type recombinase/integrase [Pseudomonadales bacterium]
MLTNSSKMKVISGPEESTDYLADDPLLQKRQRQKISLYTFILSIIIGLVYTWVRPPIFQSSAILQAQYEVSNSEQANTLAFEQLVVHQQRLTSPRVLLDLSAALEVTDGINLNANQLSKVISTEILPGSRLLSLKARGPDPEQTYRIINTWIDLYLADYRQNKSRNSGDKTKALDTQVKLLEAQVDDKQRQLEQFREEHQILSLERDESRTLNKMKALGQALDEATTERSAAAAQLAGIKKSMSEGRYAIRPQDQASIDNMETHRIELSDQLEDYSQKYTAAYMALDPEIVAVQRKLDSLLEKIKQRKVDSQQSYVNEAKQMLASAIEKEAALSQQLDAFQQTAQTFSNRYQEFSTLSEELDQLKLELQSVKSEQLQQRVREPYLEKLVVLEPPFLANQPISPHYWRDTWIAVIISLVFAILAFLLHMLVYRKKPPAVGLYPVFTQLHHQPNPPMGVTLTEPSRLTAPLPREISTREMCQLLDSANDATKMIILLLLSGVSPDEIKTICWRELDEENNRIRISGASSREILGPQLLFEVAAKLSDKTAGEDLIFSRTNEPMSKEDLESMLQCAAHDAGLIQPSPITLEDIRHTYLCFLVDQGISFSALIEIAGYIPPERLNYYQSTSLPGQKKTIDAVNCQYPLHGENP